MSHSLKLLQGILSVQINYNVLKKTCIVRHKYDMLVSDYVPYCDMCASSFRISKRALAEVLAEVIHYNWGRLQRDYGSNEVVRWLQLLQTGKPEPSGGGVAPS